MEEVGRDEFAVVVAIEEDADRQLKRLKRVAPKSAKVTKHCHDPDLLRQIRLQSGSNTFASS